MKREGRDDSHFPDCASRSNKVLPAFSCRLLALSHRPDYGRAPRDSFLIFCRRQRSTIFSPTSQRQSDRSRFQSEAESNCGARKCKHSREQTPPRPTTEKCFEQPFLPFESLCVLRVLERSGR